MSDPYQDAQRAAEKHLAACMEAYYGEEESSAIREDLPESPACAPFCGCDTCIVREVLHAARPYFAALAVAEAEDAA